MADMKLAMLAKERAREMLRGLGGIAGVGVTWDADGHACVLVNVDVEITDSERKRIPSRVEGVPVVVQVAGPIVAE